MSAIFRLPPVLLVFLLGFFLGILRFLLLLPLRRRVPTHAVLRLEGPLLWQAPPRAAWMGRLRRHPPSVEGTGRILAELAKEPGLRGVVVMPQGLKGSLVRLEALAEELGRFRRSGKEVVLYLREASARELVLAAVADRVLLAPGGTVTLVGSAAALTGLRGLLDRLGISPEFFRIGDHKTAPELFTNEHPSEIHRQLVERILDARYRRVLDVVARRKGGDLGWAEKVVDGGPYTSGRALEAGLVDELVYPIDLAAHLAGGQGKVAPPPLPPAEAVLRTRKWRFSAPPLVPKARIAVVPISGIIRTGKSVLLPGGPRMAGEETIVAQVEAARRDPRVRGVVVVSDSRGGMASASDRIWHAVWRCAQEKPTAAYVETEAASGGYLAIAGAGRIFAAPGSLVGSIGAFAGRFAVGEFLARLGVHQELLRRGKNAGLLSMLEPLREEEQEVMRAEVEQVYEEFVDRVARGRSRPPGEIRAYGEGRVFLAEEALPVLVDEIGDFRAAVRWVVEQAKLPAGSWEVQVVRTRTAGYAGLPALLGELASTPRTYWLWAPGLPPTEPFWDAVVGIRGYTDGTWER